MTKISDRRLLLDTKYHRLPVVDGDGKLVRTKDRIITFCFTIVYIYTGLFGRDDLGCFSTSILPRFCIINSILIATTNYSCKRVYTC